MDRFDDLTLVYRREIRPGQRITAVYGRAGAERVIVLSDEAALPLGFAVTAVLMLTSRHVREI